MSRVSTDYEVYSRPPFLPNSIELNVPKEVEGVVESDLPGTVPRSGLNLGCLDRVPGICVKRDSKAPEPGRPGTPRGVKGLTTIAVGKVPVGAVEVDGKRLG